MFQITKIIGQKRSKSHLQTFSRIMAETKSMVTASTVEISEAETTDNFP